MVSLLWEGALGRLQRDGGGRRRSSLDVTRSSRRHFARTRRLRRSPLLKNRRHRGAALLEGKGAARHFWEAEWEMPPKMGQKLPGCVRSTLADMATA